MLFTPQGRHVAVHFGPIEMHWRPWGPRVGAPHLRDSPPPFIPVRTRGLQVAAAPACARSVGRQSAIAAVRLQLTPLHTPSAAPATGYPTSPVPTLPACRPATPWSSPACSAQPQVARCGLRAVSRPPAIDHHTPQVAGADFSCCSARQPALRCREGQWSHESQGATGSRQADIQLLSLSFVASACRGRSGGACCNSPDAR